MTTRSSIDSEGWVDVLWIGDEETPSEVSSTTDSEFEIIGSSFDASSTSGNNAVLTKLRRPLPADPITSFATHKGATIKKNLYNSPYFAAIYDDKKLDSNQIQQPLDGNSTFDIGKWFEPGGNLEVGFKSNDNTTNVVGQKLPRHTPTNTTQCGGILWSLTTSLEDDRINLLCNKEVMLHQMKTGILKPYSRDQGSHVI